MREVTLSSSEQSPSDGVRETHEEESERMRGEPGLVRRPSSPPLVRHPLSPPIVAAPRPPSIVAAPRPPPLRHLGERLRRGGGVLGVVLAVARRLRDARPRAHARAARHAKVLDLRRAGAVACHDPVVAKGTESTASATAIVARHQTATATENSNCHCRRERRHSTSRACSSASSAVVAASSG
jgi:hypothetical protein